jgi:hypothetical protein
MAWTDEFWKPIKLRDGRVLTNLADARDLIMQLPLGSRNSEEWQRADELLARAASSPSARDDALAQTWRALKAEGLV